MFSKNSLQQKTMGFSQGFGPPKHKSCFFCLPRGTASPHRTNTAPAPSSAGHLKRLNQLISVLPIFRQTHLDHLPNGPNNEANPIINHDCWYMLISFKGYIYHVILYAQTSNKDWFDLVWPRSIFMFFWVENPPALPACEWKRVACYVCSVLSTSSS